MQLNRIDTENLEAEVEEVVHPQGQATNQDQRTIKRLTTKNTQLIRTLQLIIINI